MATLKERPERRHRVLRAMLALQQPGPAGRMTKGTRTDGRFHHYRGDFRG